MPRIEEIALDGRVLAFTLGLALLTGIACGAAPALGLSRRSAADWREGGRGLTAGRGTRWARSTFAVIQLALSLALLSGAGLMLKSFWRLTNVDPGFEPQRVLTVHVRLPRDRYGQPHQRTALWNALLDRVRSLNGVHAAGTAANPPLGGSGISESFSISGRAEPPPDERPIGQWNLVSPGYLSAMGIPLLRGRWLNPQDQARPEVVLISETMAKRYWPGENPVGQRIRFGSPERARPWDQIIGVVGDVKHYGLDDEDKPQMYQPYTALTPPWNSLVIRHGMETPALVAAVRSHIHALDPDLPLERIATMEQLVYESVSEPRFYTGLVAIFASLALLLAASGVYGVIQYSVAQRNHEFGVRAALGARGGDLMALVLRGSVRLLLPGLAAGLALALGLSRLIESQLFQVRPTDPLIYMAVAATLSAAALVAGWIPARRASKVDPAVALRHE